MARPCDVVIAPGNREFKVTAVLPVEVAAEFVDGALYARGSHTALSQSVSTDGDRRQPAKVPFSRAAR